MSPSTTNGEGAAAPAAEPASHLGLWGTLRAYYDLGQGAAVVVGRVRGLGGVVAGVTIGADPPWQLVFGATFGTFLVAVGSAALNMYLERHLDVRMDRTRSAAAAQWPTRAGARTGLRHRDERRGARDLGADDQRVGDPELRRDPRALRGGLHAAQAPHDAQYPGRGGCPARCRRWSATWPRPGSSR